MKPRNGSCFNYQLPGGRSWLRSSDWGAWGGHAALSSLLWLRKPPGHVPRTQMPCMGGCTGQADPSIPKNRQFFKAFLLTHPLPAACSHAGEVLGTLHTPNTTPAGIILQSCLGATSLMESTAGSQEIQTHTALSQQCGLWSSHPEQSGRMLVLQPSPTWQHQLNDKAAEVAD